MKCAFALSLACALITACGGSGGSGSSSSYPSVEDYDYIDLNSDNATTMMSSALDYSVDTDVNVNDGLNQDASAATSDSVLSMAQRVASDYFRTSAAQSRADSGSGDCSGGGTVSFSTNGSLIEAGDSVRVSFNNCVENGETTNGAFSILINASSDIEFDLLARYEDFSLAERGFTSTLDGDLRLAWLESGTQTTSTITIDQLNMFSSEDGNTVLSDLKIEQIEDDASQITTLSTAYELASDSLNGRVKIETPQLLSYSGYNANPNTGILRLVGENSSFVSLDADTGDIATVNLTVFDGAVTSSDEVSWSSIENTDLTGLVDF